MCARCKRSLRSEPIVIAGNGYGPRCAAIVGNDLFTAPVRKVKRTRTPRCKADARQCGLFTGLMA